MDRCPTECGCNGGKGSRIPFSESDDVVMGATACSRWSYAYRKRSLVAPVTAPIGQVTLSSDVDQRNHVDG
jgi:hypothetical protein